MTQLLNQSKTGIHSGLKALVKLILFGKEADFTPLEAEIVDGSKSVKIDSEVSSFCIPTATFSELLKVKKNHARKQLRKLKAEYKTPNILDFGNNPNFLLTRQSRAL